MKKIVGTLLLVLLATGIVGCSSRDSQESKTTRNEDKSNNKSKESTYEIRPGTDGF
ncbi:hypothetical protein AAFC75_002809, partial [Enterococcus faecium]